MQLIAFDLTQLNSDVVRIFETKYPLQQMPDTNAIVNDDIFTYLHCATDFGLKMNLWHKVDNIAQIGNTENIIFRDTNDYGKKLGDESIKISNNWTVWQINDISFTNVGKLVGIYRNSYVGLYWCGGSGKRK